MIARFARIQQYGLVEKFDGLDFPVQYAQDNSLHIEKRIVFRFES